MLNLPPPKTGQLLYNRYNTKLSIKADERAQRAGHYANKKYIVHGGHPVPTRKQFLEVSDNKQCLIQFPCGYFSNDCQDFVHKHPAKSLYHVGGGNGEEVTYITSLGTSKPSHIFSSHEEVYYEGWSASELIDRLKCECGHIGRCVLLDTLAIKVECHALNFALVLWVYVIMF